jgi:hypothetical protein
LVPLRFGLKIRDRHSEQPDAEIDAFVREKAWFKAGLYAKLGWLRIPTKPATGIRGCFASERAR